MSSTPAVVNLQIRRMTATDIDRVAEIDSLSFSLPWPKSSFDYELKNPVSRLWVVEIEDPTPVSKIAGMICLWVIENEGHIATFAIHPDYRRLGLGAFMLARTLFEASREGVELVYLEVRRSNLAAIRMYHEFGFEMTGSRAGYYSDNHEDALMMTLAMIDPQVLQTRLEKYG
jgi:[ribosomal protein S18]-alanine N-acetyltransferase